MAITIIDDLNKYMVFAISTVDLAHEFSCGCVSGVSGCVVGRDLSCALALLGKTRVFAVSHNPA
jgi:hypothetical protein